MAAKRWISGYRLNANKVYTFIYSGCASHLTAVIKIKKTFKLLLLVAKISDSQYSKSTNTSYYCNSEANLLSKSLMKLKHRVAYQRKQIPSKRSSFMQKNLESGEFSQKSL